MVSYNRMNEFLDTFDVLKAYNVSRKDPLGADYDEMAIDLADGKTAFWFNGNWAWPNLSEAGAENEDEYGFLPYFLNNDPEDFANQKIQGSPSKQVMLDGQMVSEMEKAAAKEFLNWIVYSEIGQQMLVKTCNIIPPFANNPYEPSDPLSRDIYEKVHEGKAFNASAIVPNDHWSVLGAAMLAYYIVGHKNWISNMMFALMVASMIIPFQAIMIPLVSIYGGTLNILNHRITLIFMHTGFSMAMSVFMFHGFINGNIPIALEEAAYIDGCTHSQTFFKIVFLLLKPIISTMVILNALAFWNDFLLPSLVLTDKKLLTLPLSTYSFYGTYSADYGTIMAGLLLCVIPILILYVVLQKQIISGVVSGAVK